MKSMEHFAENDVIFIIKLFEKEVAAENMIVIILTIRFLTVWL